MFRTNVLNFTAIVSVLVVGASAQAGHVVEPEDLKPGDTYHLAFITVGFSDATSSDIADYNQFINNQAALNPALTGTDDGVQWSAIASTATDNARDNAVVGFFSPVYLMDGTSRIADGFSDFWNGSLAIPLFLDQFVVSQNASQPWTGSLSTGIGNPADPLGSATPSTGSANSINFQWIDFSDATSPTLRPLYALSQELTVHTPEPATTGLLLIGSALAWARRRRRPAGQRPLAL